MSRSDLAVVSIVTACILTTVPAEAQTSLGGGWAFTCSDGKPPAANGSCNRGGTASGSQPAAGNPAVNAAARNAEIERARQKLGTQRQALANSRAREATEAENRRRREADRQSQFQRERDANAAGLKGVSRELGLRDAVRDTPPVRSTATPSALRPSERRALAQAACGLSVLSEALRNSGGTSDMASALGQASFIMDGSRPPAAKCPEPPQWEMPPGVDAQDVVDRARAITTRAQGLVRGQELDRPSPPARVLTADEQRIQAAYRAQQDNERRLRNQDAPVVAAQERINTVQQRKYDTRDANAIAREQQSKAELRTYVSAIQKLQEGKVAEFLDMSAGADVDALLNGTAQPKRP